MSDTPNILVIGHSENPPTAKLAEILPRLGFSMTIVRTPFGEKLPPQESVAGVIILGAPVSVYAYVELAWLQEELRWVEKYLRLKRPIFGICFGCQMLAHLLGGKVVEGDYGREFGFTSVAPTGEDAIFGSELAGLDVFQAHGDTFTVPDAAQHLMAGDVYHMQAAKFGERLYGVQFHPEITGEIVARWHRFGLDRGRQFGESVPATPEAHQALAEQKLPPVHDWLELFLKRLLK